MCVCVIFFRLFHQLSLPLSVKCLSNKSSTSSSRTPRQFVSKTETLAKFYQASLPRFERKTREIFFLERRSSSFIVT